MRLLVQDLWLLDLYQQTLKGRNVITFDHFQVVSIFIKTTQAYPLQPIPPGGGPTNKSSSQYLRVSIVYFILYTESPYLLLGWFVLTRKLCLSFYNRLEFVPAILVPYVCELSAEQKNAVRNSVTSTY